MSVQQLQQEEQRDYHGLATKIKCRSPDAKDTLKTQRRGRDRDRDRERVREREGKNECEKKEQNKINRNWEKCRPAVSGKVLGAHICQLFAVPPKLLSFSSHAHFVLRTTSARSFWQQKPDTGRAGVPGEG